MSRILIISDLHLGCRDRADDFGNNDIKLIHWIEKLDPDKVILNGDIYELWQRPFKKIFEAHKGLCKWFRTSWFEHIQGNHDLRLMSLDPLTRELMLADGRRVLISNGFQNDKLMTSPFSRALVWCLSWLEKIWPNIDNEEGYGHDRKKTRIDKNTDIYASNMFAKGYDVVICGHTHKQIEIKLCLAKTKIIDTHYLNCGTCQHGKLQGVLIDTEKSTVKLVKGK